MRGVIINIVLYQPEKPLNTGNIGRTCVLTNSKLHLIKPFNFSLSDKEIRRAGLDYWQYLDLELHESFEEFYNKYKDEKIYISTTKASRYYTDVKYSYNDFLLFGKESSGLPEYIRNIFDGYEIRVPMEKNSKRSLNISNTANIILYEALRQLDFPGMI